VEALNQPVLCWRTLDLDLRSFTQGSSWRGPVCVDFRARASLVIQDENPFLLRDGRLDPLVIAGSIGAHQMSVILGRRSRRTLVVGVLIHSGTGTEWTFLFRHATTSRYLQSSGKVSSQVPQREEPPIGEEIWEGKVAFRALSNPAHLSWRTGNEAVTAPVVRQDRWCGPVVVLDRRRSRCEALGPSARQVGDEGWQREGVQLEP
jgi:hypothetical protein